MLRKPLIVFAALVLLAVPLAACGSSGGGSKTYTESSFRQKLEESNLKSAPAKQRSKYKAVDACVADKLFNGGDFTKDQIQKIANGKAGKDKALSRKYYTNVLTPCAQKAGLPTG